MAAINVALLKRLCEAPGIPSREDAIRAVVIDALRPLVDDLRVDVMGNVVGDLSSRRGMIQGMEDLPGLKVIRAEVPLAEMFGYSTALRSATQGRATYTMEFKHYTEAPKNVADAIINKR